MKELNESAKPALTVSQKSRLLKLERKLDALAKMAGRDDISRMVYGGIRDEYSNLVYYYQGKGISPMRDFRGMYRDFERLGVGRKTNTDFSNLVYEIGDELSAYIKANIDENE